MSGEGKKLQYEQGEGSLRLGPLRYMLVRPETLTEIQKGVEDRLGPKSAEYLYAAGASWAMGALRRLAAALAEDPESIAHAFCRHTTKLGWGRFELQSVDSNGRKLAVQVTSSPLAEAYGSSDLPVCHLFAGVVGGLAEWLFKMPTSCNEQMCAARGEPACLFVAEGHDVAGTDKWEW